MLVDHSFLHRYFRYRLTVIVMSGSTDFPYLSMSIGRYSPMFYSVHTAICSMLVPMCAITLTIQPSAQSRYIYLPYTRQDSKIGDFISDLFGLD